jgi:prophage regulatory protein
MTNPDLPAVQLQERLLRLPEVIARVGLRRSSIYAQIKRQTFPAAVKLGERAVAWSESSVNGWIDARLGDRPRTLP